MKVMRLSNENLTPRLFYIVVLLLLVSSCAKRHVTHIRVEKEKGIASWYGPRFHGKRTASGERYDQNKMTAAHRTLPFGTLVKVHNMDNDKSAVVRINDRGPFGKGRIIDVSKAAAKELGMIGSGTARVIVFYLPPDMEVRFNANKSSDKDRKGTDGGPSARRAKRRTI